MIVTAKPIAELQEEGLPFLVQEQIPTHQVRVVLRTADVQSGPNPYVDGTDLFLAIDEKQQTAEFVWEDETLGDAPLFHGGEVPSALTWARELEEPFYFQYNAPFLLTAPGNITDQK